ncbi:MAG: YggS family pyridoxal phosphate-dependent enzyme [Pseudomonadota bacterium]
MNAGETTIEQRLETTRDEIRAAEREFGREPNSVQLIAVSKTKPVDDIHAAIACGQRDFGENYLDEAVAKVKEVNNPELIWHFIGSIQSNKTKLAAAHCDWVHCIDREKIARRMSDQRPEHLHQLNVCIQINIDNEDSKAGITLDEIEPLADKIAALPRLSLRGLMVIPRPAETFDAQRAPLARTREAFERLRTSHPQIDTLSMGMSADLRAAVAEGATMVRIGTAIFGARPPKP